MSETWRTHTCAQIDAELIDESVRVAGWVHRRRDHGGLIFVDLRDRTGLVQLVFRPEDKEPFSLAEQIRNEYVVSAGGVVNRRPEGLENPNLTTGQIEIQVGSLQIVNPAKTPPIYVDGDSGVEDALRLKYRYLDLRRPEMYKNLLIRHRAAKATRDYLDRQGFLEIETPMLTKSTPEGARDYLVPSRIAPGEFYALPQSPQLFKQILMVAGVDRYFQIARCFRDEDLRSERQPEFTQIDIEMAFAEESEILQLTEGLICHVFESTLGLKLPSPFRRITYDDSMLLYGSDKPDLRFGMQICDLSEGLFDCSFRLITDALESGQTVRGFCASGCGDYSRKQIDALIERAKSLGAGGLLWAAFSEDNIRSSFGKFMREEHMQHIRNATGARPGDLVLIAVGDAGLVSVVLGQIRLELGKELGLTANPGYEAAWVTDFPLFETNKDGGITSSHHPFTAPRTDDMRLLGSDPLAVKSLAYDLVINGYEVGGGSIRIHQRHTQEQVFAALGIKKHEAADKFGFLLEAFEYGAPPHGGIALGLDRLAMLLAGCDSIRDVIAFPKTTSASDLMVGAPSEIDDEKLTELHLKRIRTPDCV